MIIVTHEKIIPQKIIHESFGLIELGLFIRGRYQFMLQVPLNIPKWELARVTQIANQVLTDGFPEFSFPDKENK